MGSQSITAPTVRVQNFQVAIKRGSWDLFDAHETFSGRRFATCAQVNNYMRSHSDCPAVRTDTFLVYASRDEMLGKMIKFFGMMYEVPEKYQPLVNHALVLSYSDIRMVKTFGGTIVTGNVIKAMRIPSTSGLYEDIDPETGIPIGTPSEVTNPNALYLVRRKGKGIEGHYMGTAIRGVSESHLRRNVSIGFYPTVCFGTALLEPVDPNFCTDSKPVNRLVIDGFVSGEFEAMLRDARLELDRTGPNQLSRTKLLIRSLKGAREE